MNCLNFKTVPQSQLRGRLVDKMVATCVKSQIADITGDSKKFIVGWPSRMMETKNLVRENCEFWDDMDK